MADLFDENIDPYLIPGTDVLQNKLNITDQEELKEVGKRISLERIYELRMDAVGTLQNAGLLQEDEITFGAEHLRKIHYYILGEVYPFAGQYRKMDIVAKGRPPAPPSYIYKFMTHYDIKMELEMTLSNMARSLPYKNFTNKDQYAKWLADYFERLIHIHPFREGNGRAIKEYLTEFVEYNNDKIPLPPVEIDWSKMDSDVLSNITYQMTIQENCLQDQLKKGLVYKENEKTEQPSIK